MYGSGSPTPSHVCCTISLAAHLVLANIVTVSQATVPLPNKKLSAHVQGYLRPSGMWVPASGTAHLRSM